MTRTTRIHALAGLILAVLPTAACGNDNPPPPYGTVADLIGVGARCKNDNECLHTEAGTQNCLLEFKGGYCGLKNCTSSAGCPPGSGCVTYQGANYCFRECGDKPECNLNRPADIESNCSSSENFIDRSGKVCIPPSG